MMREITLRQLAATFIITFIALAGYEASRHFFPAIHHPLFYALAGWFFFQDLTLGIILRNAAQAPDARKFVGMFQICIGIKFIFALVILLMLILKFPAIKKLVAFQFMALYLFYLLADTILLLRLISRK